jgi:hypothetical protein
VQMQHTQTEHADLITGPGIQSKLRQAYLSKLVSRLTT